MNKHLLIFSFLILMILPSEIFGQRWKLLRYEASAGLGVVNFFGDIGGTADVNNMAGFKDIQLQYSRLSVFLGATYRIREDMNVKMNLIYGSTRGDDVDSRNNDRNFAFTSTIFEPSFQFEYYVIPESKAFASSATFNRRGMLNDFAHISLYGFAGIGGIFSNPKPDKDYVAVFDDNFSKFGICFPLGIGLKFTVSTQWSLGFEFGRRFTLTDYIDGYTTVFSKHKDTYYIGALSAIYKIRSDRNGMPTFKRSYR